MSDCRVSYQGGEQLHYYLHQNGFQGLRERDLGINTESAEELVNGDEQIDEGVVTRTNVIDRRRGSDVTEICRWDRRMGDIRRVGWQCQFKKSFCSGEWLWDNDQQQCIATNAS